MPCPRFGVWLGRSGTAVLPARSCAWAVLSVFLAAGPTTTDSAVVGGKTQTRLVIPGVEENKVGEVCRFGDLGWGVESLAFSPDGALLAVGKMDRALMVYDIARKTRTAFCEKLEQLGQVTCVAFSPDGSKLLAGGYGGRIQIWEVGAGGSLTEGSRFVGHANAIRAVTISSDSKLVLSGGNEKKARCWELETAGPTGLSSPGRNRSGERGALAP
jgi:WD40 repeat protein